MKKSEALQMLASRYNQLNRELIAMSKTFSLIDSHQAGTIWMSSHLSRTTP